MTMEELLASYSPKIQTVSRNDEVEGKVIAISEDSIILDINTKSDAVLLQKELSSKERSELKVGGRIRAFVLTPENDSGQTILTKHLPVPVTRGFSRGGGRSQQSFTKFIQAQKDKTELNGKVVEVNRGGLLVEVDSVRGFLPNSQIGSNLLDKIADGSEMVGKMAGVLVIEVDEKNSRLVFTQKGLSSEETIKKLSQYHRDDQVKGVIAEVFPFGMAIKVGDVMGLVFTSDISWDENVDLTTFKKGDEVNAMVVGVDEGLGKIGLSLKHMQDDPFTKIAQKYQPDDVVSGEVTRVDSEGITFRLSDGIEASLPASKSDKTYKVGDKASVLIDLVDTQRRKITLSPMVTSTEGLIYK